MPGASVTSCSYKCCLHPSPELQSPMSTDLPDCGPARSSWASDSTHRPSPKPAPAPAFLPPTEAPPSAHTRPHSRSLTLTNLSFWVMLCHTLKLSLPHKHHVAGPLTMGQVLFFQKSFEPYPPKLPLSTGPSLSLAVPSAHCHNSLLSTALPSNLSISNVHINHFGCCC